MWLHFFAFLYGKFFDRVKLRMFPIVNNLNQLSSAINTLNQEVAKLKTDKTSQHGLDGVSLKNNIESVRADLNKTNIDINATLNDLKRNIENFKLEITRDIGMIEATILRKCESSMSKMVTDKLNLAMESQKSGFKEMIDQEIELKLHAINDGLTLPDATDVEPFDMTLGSSEKDVPAPTKRSYSKQRGKSTA